ncbi:hypothetical protein EG68_11957 [Paragonimus skrjabini miyazakii]|uniref:Small ribosomal subunit protein mS25 n=1 Tax=Paragonimus skrjabini miyazakii TaxID=59628 RepID=A0A8S9YBR3_9TREM|nr:hypothetical protein EG68_11957 [Paragonimus skrjabini miyazakii]
MPFLKGGRLALTRTKNYLGSGRILLNDAVKIITIHHVPGQDISKGCDELIKWFLPPLQFKNPKVQIITLKNMCPTPFVQVYLDNDEEILVDCSFRKGSEIHDHLKSILGKPNHSPSIANVDAKPDDNPANFGIRFPRQCICEIYGQMPCSAHIGRPNPWPGREPQLPVIEGITDCTNNSTNNTPVP